MNCPYKDWRLPRFNAHLFVIPASPFVIPTSPFVIPAKAGIQIHRFPVSLRLPGMTQC